eukprot:CAMPEP_0175135180 /NCGR_PEP_ID=MMETSP0087-20121206/8579_1 /TAXON_ID=136419 /ORGANISM="Unknown Unknown, Strain D1" /LENGTH=653 /DNA_ID=CAMNT_0016417801 /DNA_START=10 /DNA_END=1972 /DNA_ORIENTATION=-
MADEEEKVPVGIGIDLGTTYSCVGIWRDTQVEIIANDQGNRTTPSYVAFSEEDIVVGDAAKNQAPRNPTNTIFDAKRLIGRQFSDPVIQDDIKGWPFKVVADEHDKPLIEVEFKGEQKQYTPEQISSMVLIKMKETAEAYVGHEIKDAVITCPAYFNDSQRAATKDAGTIAGLNVLRVINEPTAAAIAYGIGNQEDEEKLVLVFDLGGGTFDVSLLAITEGVFEVRATAGDTHLGGEDFDALLMNHVIDTFKKKHKGMDPSRNAKALGGAGQPARKQRGLCRHANIEVESFCEGIDLVMPVSRARFEDLCATYFKGCMDPVNKVLEDCKLSKQRIDEIVLVGGSTRIPKITQMIKDAFHGKEPNKTINPDEAVAYGAAVQAAILMGDTSEETENLLLIDVAPLSLGVETAGGMMSTLIKRNSTIPADASRLYSTNEDNQTVVECKLYEGERPKTKDNNLLGQFDLEGIPPMAAGVPRVEIKLHLDASGILSVTAQEKTTNKKAEIKISNSGRLTAEQVQAMVDEAERYKDSDEAAVEVAKARMELETMLVEMRDTINDPSLRINGEDYSTIEKAVKWVQSWIVGTPNAKVKDFQKQMKETQDIVDPILIQLFKGKNLAARNCGLLTRKREEVMLMVTDNVKRQKMIADQSKKA